MSVVISIPLVTINQGVTRTLAPTAVSNLSSADFAIARDAGTVSLNTRTQDADVLEMVIEFSKDGGATWPDSNRQVLAGGSFVNHDGTAKLVDHFAMSIDPAVNMVQGHVTADIRVSVSGSITVT